MSAGGATNVVLITGIGGQIGQKLAGELSSFFRVVGMDLPDRQVPYETIGIDLTDSSSVEAAFETFRQRYGEDIASVVHLAAYFDFTGEANPLYDAVNVAGTRRLLQALRSFRVEQFIYAGTMLVHEAAAPGGRINEATPIDPKWAYPESKARAEHVIREEHGRIPYVLLHIAGLYSEQTAVPTLAHQIKRVYERSLKSHIYPADPGAGQAFVHEDDLIDAIRRAIDRRSDLPLDATLLIGEPDTLSFQELQDEIGRLIHGSDTWTTVQVPKSLAHAGAWLEAKAEPAIPDALDQGAKPFIRPFMIALADQNYAIDITQARNLLGWMPQHRLRASLPDMIERLKADPAA